MRTFFTWGSLLMASLLIYSACDSGVMPTEDRIDTPPGDPIGIDAVEDPLKELRDELRPHIKDFYNYYEDLRNGRDPNCTEGENIDSLVEETDSLLTLANDLFAELGDDTNGDPINMWTYAAITEDLTESDWERFDVDQAEELTTSLNAVATQFHDACPYVSTKVDDMTEVFERYASDLDLSVEQVYDLMDGILRDAIPDALERELDLERSEASSSPSAQVSCPTCLIPLIVWVEKNCGCKCDCTVKASGGVSVASGFGVLGAAACTASGPVCWTGAGLVGAGALAIGVVEGRKCRKGCEGGDGSAIELGSDFASEFCDNPNINLTNSKKTHATITDD